MFWVYLKSDPDKPIPCNNIKIGVKHIIIEKFLKYSGIPVNIPIRLEYVLAWLESDQVVVPIKLVDKDIKEITECQTEFDATADAIDEMSKAYEKLGKKIEGNEQ